MNRLSKFTLFAVACCLALSGLSFAASPWPEVSIPSLPEEVQPQPLSSQDKLVAITFDDGPGPYTDILLDELAARNVKATFFLFAQKVDDCTEPLLLRMQEEGHCIASHTYSHARLTSLSNPQIAQELEKADEAISQVTGQSPQLIRPPFGAYDQRVIDACGKPVILWSLDTRDWELDNPETVCQNILGAVQDGDIVLLHELKRSSKDGVIAAIDVMIEEGYHFVTVPELFRLRGIPLEAGRHYHDARDPNHDQTLEWDVSSR